MIGVIANLSYSSAVCEFFELFKTPWEWCRNEVHYDVLLCAGNCVIPESEARLLVLYSGCTLTVDSRRVAETHLPGGRGGRLRYKGRPLPIYGDYVSFRVGTSVLTDEVSSAPVMYVEQYLAKTVARIGYDLFEEVRRLLAEGQPPINAGIPTLELHISLLRELIIASGAQLAEIPPVPDGYRFAACLTHDVDHPSIRRHKIDPTALGFLVRAVLGSMVKALRGRISARVLLRNWVAALKLPLVQLGLAKDFWYGFDRYLQLDGSRSTFFVIPFKGRPGRLPGGSAPKRRAARYGAADIANKIRALASQGGEVGLHGIDAWLDGSDACAELDQIRQITGLRDVGVRMHWLYFGIGSPLHLDRAGADYDSTIGYNETVGYRAGTSQAYRPLGATRLLELPLHIMDTALFFPSHLNLSFKEARKRVSAIIENAVDFGGVVTINWHDRSIAPERCWGSFYEDLLGELKSRGAWFATAGEAVSWFRKRRSATFNAAFPESGISQFAAGDGTAPLPPLPLRLYNTSQERIAKASQSEA